MQNFLPVKHLAGKFDFEGNYLGNLLSETYGSKNRIVWCDGNALSSLKILGCNFVSFLNVKKAWKIIFIANAIGLPCYLFQTRLVDGEIEQIVVVGSYKFNFQFKKLIKKNLEIDNFIGIGYDCELNKFSELSPPKLSWFLSQNRKKKKKG